MSLAKNINQVFLRGFEKMVHSYMQSIKSLASVTYADEQKYISQMSAIDAYDEQKNISQMSAMTGRRE